MSLMVPEEKLETNKIMENSKVPSGSPSCKSHFVLKKSHVYNNLFRTYAIPYKRIKISVSMILPSLPFEEYKIFLLKKLKKNIRFLQNTKNNKALEKRWKIFHFGRSFSRKCKNMNVEIW